MTGKWLIAHSCRRFNDTRLQLKSVRPILEKYLPHKLSMFRIRCKAERKQILLVML